MTQPARCLLVSALVMAQPADAAACHRFSRWLYPYPQRCAVTASREPAPLPPSPPPPRPMNDDEARALGIERLKALMAKP